MSCFRSVVGRSKYLSRYSIIGRPEKSVAGNRKTLRIHEISVCFQVRFRILTSADHSQAKRIVGASVYTCLLTRSKVVSKDVS